MAGTLLWYLSFFHSRIANRAKSPRTLHSTWAFLFHSRSIRHSCALRVSRNPNRRSSSFDSWPRTRQGRTRMRSFLTGGSSRFYPGSAPLYWGLAIAARGGQIRPPRCAKYEARVYASNYIGVHLRRPSPGLRVFSRNPTIPWDSFFQSPLLASSLLAPQTLGGRGPLRPSVSTSSTSSTMRECSLSTFKRCVRQPFDYPYRP